MILILVIYTIQILLSAAAGVWLLWKRKEQNDHSRYILGSFCILLAISGMVFMGSVITNPAESLVPDSIINPYFGMFCFLMGLLLPLYLYEMRNPHQLSVKWLIGLLAPWATLCLAFVVWHWSTGWQSLELLQGVDEIAQNISSIEVLLSLALVLAPLPYCVIVFIHSYSWHQTSLPQPWIKWLTFSICISTLTYVLGVMLPIPGVVYVHGLMLVALVVLAVYIETIRVPVPQTPHVHPTIAGVAQHLQEIMQTGIWQNPDFDRDDYCRLVGTNRQYMADAVHALGYNNLSDMLNRYRLEALSRMIEQNPKTNVQELAFLAGFRNRKTADRFFMERYGCSMASYNRKQLHKNELN